MIRRKSNCRYSRPRIASKMVVTSTMSSFPSLFVSPGSLGVVSKWLTAMSYILNSLSDGAQFRRFPCVTEQCIQVSCVKPLFRGGGFGIAKREKLSYVKYFSKRSDFLRFYSYLCTAFMILLVLNCSNKESEKLIGQKSWASRLYCLLCKNFLLLRNL